MPHYFEEEGKHIDFDLCVRLCTRAFKLFNLGVWNFTYTFLMEKSWPIIIFFSSGPSYFIFFNNVPLKQIIINFCKKDIEKVFGLCGWNLVG